MSSMFRTVKMPGRSMPGSGGRTGSAPGASTNASYRSTLTAPVARFCTSIVWFWRSMLRTSCRVRTSMLKKSRNRSGVATSRRFRLAIAPPM